MRLPGCEARRSPDRQIPELAAVQGGAVVLVVTEALRQPCPTAALQNATSRSCSAAGTSTTILDSLL
jgi:hypothetical protein